MGSNSNYFLLLGPGLNVSDHYRRKSLASARETLFENPKNIGNLKKEENALGNFLHFAGGNNGDFKMVDLEVWGVD